MGRELSAAGTSGVCARALVALLLWTSRSRARRPFSLDQRSCGQVRIEVLGGRVLHKRWDRAAPLAAGPRDVAGLLPWLGPTVSTLLPLPPTPPPPTHHRRPLSAQAQIDAEATRVEGEALRAQASQAANAARRERKTLEARAAAQAQAQVQAEAERRAEASRVEGEALRAQASQAANAARRERKALEARAAAQAQAEAERRSREAARAQAIAEAERRSREAARAQAQAEAERRSREAAQAQAQADAARLSLQVLVGGQAFRHDTTLTSQSEIDGQSNKFGVGSKLLAHAGNDRWTPVTLTEVVTKEGSQLDATHLERIELRCKGASGNIVFGEVSSFRWSTTAEERTALEGADWRSFHEWGYFLRDAEAKAATEREAAAQVKRDAEAKAAKEREAAAQVTRDAVAKAQREREALKTRDSLTAARGPNGQPNKFGIGTKLLAYRDQNAKVLVPMTVTDISVRKGSNGTSIDPIQLSVLDDESGKTLLGPEVCFRWPYPSDRTVPPGADWRTFREWCEFVRHSPRATAATAVQAKRDAEALEAKNEREAQAQREHDTSAARVSLTAARGPDGEPNKFGLGAKVLVLKPNAEWGPMTINKICSESECSLKITVKAEGKSGDSLFGTIRQGGDLPFKWSDDDDRTPPSGAEWLTLSDWLALFKRQSSMRFGHGVKVKVHPGVSIGEHSLPSAISDGVIFEHLFLSGDTYGKSSPEVLVKVTGYGDREIVCGDIRQKTTTELPLHLFVVCDTVEKNLPWRLTPGDWKRLAPKRRHFISELFQLHLPLDVSEVEFREITETRDVYREDAIFRCVADDSYVSEFRHQKPEFYIDNTELAEVLRRTLSDSCPDGKRARRINNVLELMERQQAKLGVDHYGAKLLNLALDAAVSPLAIKFVMRHASENHAQRALRDALVDGRERNFTSLMKGLPKAVSEGICFSVLLRDACSHGRWKLLSMLLNHYSCKADTSADLALSLAGPGFLMAPGLCTEAGCDSAFLSRLAAFGWRPGIDQVIAATNAKRCDLLRCLLTTFEIDRAGFGELDIADIVEDAADDLLESLIGAGINPNGVCNSTPPIVISMRFGKYHFTELLLSHGADPNAVDPKTGNTALHEAMARAGNDEKKVERSLEVLHKSNQPLATKLQVKKNLPE